MIKNNHDLLDLVHSLSLPAGSHKTCLPYLTIYHDQEEKVELPHLDHSYLFVVLTGAIRLHTPSGMMDYVAGQYFVSAIDTPIAGDVFSVSEEQDFYALMIEFTLNDVISVVLDLSDNLAEKILKSEVDESTMNISDQYVLDALYRLMDVIKVPAFLAYLGKQIRNEIIFYLLCGSQGRQFLQSAIRIQ